MALARTAVEHVAGGPREAHPRASTLDLLPSPSIIHPPHPAHATALTSLHMIDHLLGKPSSTWKRTQVSVEPSIWGSEGDPPALTGFPPSPLAVSLLLTSPLPPLLQLPRYQLLASSARQRRPERAEGLLDSPGQSVTQWVARLSRSTVRPCLRPTSLLMRRKGKGHTQRAPSSLLSDALPSALHGNSLLLLCFPISSE